MKSARDLAENGLVATHGRVCPSLCALLIVSVAGATRMHAQVALPPGWTVSGEAGAVAGSTWLNGNGAPRVTSKIGFLFGVAAMRSLRNSVAAGAAFRVGIQPLELKENGATWSGGTLAEYDLVAKLAFPVVALRSLNAAIEVGGGTAVLSGANDVLPFSGAPSVAPLAEVGASVNLGPATSRRTLALVLRYGLLRMTLDDATTEATSGWVSRLTAGIRVTR
jgi:hypothetical protein